MRLILFSILWFVAVFIGLSVIELFVLGFMIYHTYHPIGVDAGVSAGAHFAKAHAAALDISRVGILLTAFAVSLIGSIKGVLPGTHRTAR